MENKNLADLSDDALIDLAVKGRNQQAWTALITRYYGKVATTVCRIMGKNSDSEDVVQEVFINMAKAAKDFKHESLFSTFLYKIAVNTTYSYIQRSINRKETTEKPEFFLRIGDGRNGTESAVLKQERARMLNLAMEKLTPEKRFVLTLYEVEGVPLKEIAAILKQPLQTVWSRINQTKKELYEQLKGI
ncbi:RNA polymerase sigma factor [bacterium]|nr:RNA polymerase sigma factor [bacterium]